MTSSECKRRLRPDLQRDLNRCQLSGLTSSVFWKLKRDTKWMFPKIGGKPPKWMIWGVFPLFLETPK